jgi:ADP-ribose pyrophosphatase
MIRDWPVISREQVGDFRIFSLHKKRVHSPRTGEISEVQALRFPDWVLILALTPQEEVVMVRQYRHGTEQVCLELPGGLVDPGDHSLELSAKRDSG